MLTTLTYAKPAHAVGDDEGRHENERSRDDERPRNHLPSPEGAREASAFGISDRSGNRREREQRIGRLRDSATLPEREGDDDGAAERGAPPESA
jgi:hypothetical protein